MKRPPDYQQDSRVIQKWIVKRLLGEGRWPIKYGERVSSEEYVLCSPLSFVHRPQGLMRKHDSTGRHDRPSLGPTLTGITTMSAWPVRASVQLAWSQAHSSRQS